MKTVLDLLLVAFLILVNAFFSGTEMAVITLNDAKIRKMSEEGNKRAKKVVRFLDKPYFLLLISYRTMRLGTGIPGAKLFALDTADRDSITKTIKAEIRAFGGIGQSVTARLKVRLTQ